MIFIRDIDKIINRAYTLISPDIMGTEINISAAACKKIRTNSVFDKKSNLVSLSTVECIFFKFVKCSLFGIITIYSI